ncbi:MAG: N-acetylmuramoyl-L-alanine amidase [Proteobacteria bacterium]|nr:N-acetylmuramoyl-L-alanine amidase [Pseudomonadota bacterium]
MRSFVARICSSRRRTRTAGLLLLCGLGAGPVLAAQVHALRLSTVAAGTRLEVALSEAVTDSLFTLDNPSRVVLDLKPASLDRQFRLPAAQGLVHQIRVGPRDGGGLRIVLEVDRQVVARRLPPSGGERRLLLELTAAEPVHVAPAPLASSAAAPAAIAAAAPVTVPVTAPAPPSRQLPAARDLVIAVDAGHGGEDPGATGRDGTHEKSVTLAVARVLAARINAERGMRAVLTRDGDYFVPLRERIHRARVAQADLFVSVHADAVRDPSVAGSSVYVLSARGATSEAAKWLADRENAADLVGGVSLDNKDNVLASVLLDLSQSAAMSSSMVAAEKVLIELNQVGEVRKARVQQAGFVVLKSPDIPSLLIETAYITNPDEERRLRDEKYQSRLADAILAGVLSYFHENPPPGTRLAALVAQQR